jgi:hypothetical protein
MLFYLPNAMDAMTMSMTVLSQPVGSPPKPLGRKLAAVLLAVVVLVAVVFILVGASSSPNLAKPDQTEPQLSSLEARGLQFIKDVLSVDTAKYNVTVETFDPVLGSATEEQIAQAGSTTHYSLNSSTSNLLVSCTFKNSNLIWADLYLYSGEILFTGQPSSNLTEAAQNFLIAYQVFSERNITDTLQTLNGVNPASDTTVKLGTLKLTTTHKDLTGTVFGDTTAFSWVNTYSGFDYSYLSVSFQDGHFGGFIDNYLRYPIGDTSVNITAQEALQIGLDAAETYSYDMGAGITVSNFDIASTEVILNPQTRNDVLYPCYTVYLNFNGTYPGSVHGLIVFVWAGTGEIHLISLNAYCEPTDYY